VAKRRTVPSSQKKGGSSQKRKGSGEIRFPDKKREKKQTFESVQRGKKKITSERSRERPKNRWILMEGRKKKLVPCNKVTRKKGKFEQNEKKEKNSMRKR